MNDIEEWRQVEGWLYEVSSLGNVRTTLPHSIPCMRRRFPAGHLLKPCTSDRGYFYVNLSSPEFPRGRKRAVHIIVAAAFVGPRPDGKQVNHIDGNKKNNRASNLEYITASENQLHATRTGLRRVGTSLSNSKLCDRDVVEIRRLRPTASLAELGRMFDVNPATIYDVCIGRTWKHVRDDAAAAGVLT